ncbi:unnamed protein product [Mytilus coruscus]|uniref:MAM domain-containing protein n=1 Tax=Mytilus coruscus TaxID=42192 RepID=A0A6J8CBZ6_MYTCO|nr:unnamed protein product [Mytilus coruscus]
MYIEASDKRINDSAQLVSKPIVRKSGQCLTFWYHMKGDHIGTLNVYQKHKMMMTNIWTKIGEQGHHWKQAKVDLAQYEYYQIVIEGVIKDSYSRWKGDIAIDDVYVYEGECNGNRKDICNFENSESCDLINSLDDPKSDIFWNIIRGKTWDNGHIGPVVDHTTSSGNGHFIHLEAETSVIRRLYSNSIKLTGPICCTFWYYIVGNTWSNLSLYKTSDIETRQILSIHGDSEEKWKKRTISIDIAYYDKLIIEGSLEQPGSISVDDISLSGGACIEDEIFNHTCLRIDWEFEIEECATFYLQKDSLDVTFIPSFTNSNNGQECIDKENEIVMNLVYSCRENYLYSNCKFNFWDYVECFTFKKKILVTYICTDEETTTVSSVITSRGDSSAVSDESDTLPRVMTNSSDSATGLVVGLVIGALLLICVVIMIVILFRRHTFKSSPREKTRNNLGGNDYIGSQVIALPLTANHSSHMQNNGMFDGISNASVHGYDSTNANDQINNVQHEYTNVGLTNGFVNKEKVQVPTYAYRQDEIFPDIHMSNDDEYAIVDPTAETSFNGTMDNRTGTADSYMVLDPTETGFNRQIFPNTPVGYEFAKPVKDTENTICNDDQYAISDEGVYDHSGSNRHKELENNIYNHAVDTMYDSGSHKRNIEGEEDTYNHFFGQKTEDDYDVSRMT